MTQILACCNQLLTADGLWRGVGVYREKRWQRYDFSRQVNDGIEGAFLVGGVPLDIHCHGFGSVDFSEIGPEHLEHVNRAAADQGIACLPTIYLRRERLDLFVETLHAFQRARAANRVPNLLGFALEGPLLGSAGGTPQAGTWLPTKSDWERLGALGEKGLRYVVISPDVLEFGAGTSADIPDLEWVLTLLVRAGIKPALGHFQRVDAEASARCIEKALVAIERAAGGADPNGVITDHLFNDMPLRFRHAWRRRDQRELRQQELDRQKWSWDGLPAQVGEVPAALMWAAKDGRLTLCMNFDGEHVDHEYCKRAVRLLGAERIIAITDRTDTAQLAGAPLHRHEDSSLLWQEQELVAAGTQPIAQQMQHMHALGLTPSEAWSMFLLNPARVFGVSTSTLSSQAPALSSVVAGVGEWIMLQADAEPTLGAAAAG